MGSNFGDLDVEQAVAKPADSSEDRLRKRTFTLITFLKCLCCVPWALMYAALGLSVAALLPLSYGTVILIGIAVFFAKGGKGFVDVTSAGGFGNIQKGHGVAFADLDNDGDQDVFEQLGGFPAPQGFLGHIRGSIWT